MKKLPLFAKFTVSSLVSAGVDFLFFFLVQKTLENSGHSMTNSIIAATVSARFLSTAVNFLINKFWSFESQQNGTRQVILFTFLFLVFDCMTFALRGREDVGYVGRGEHSSGLVIPSLHPEFRVYPQQGCHCECHDTACHDDNEERLISHSVLYIA